MQKAKPKFRVRQEAKEKNKDKRSDLFLGLPCLTHVCEEGKESSLRYHRPSFCLSIFFVFYSFSFSFFPPKARERASTRRENEIDERVHKTGLFGLPWVLLVYVFRLLIYFFRLEREERTSLFFKFCFCSRRRSHCDFEGSRYCTIVLPLARWLLGAQFRVPFTPFSF